IRYRQCRLCFDATASPATRSLGLETLGPIAFAGDRPSSMALLCRRLCPSSFSSSLKGTAMKIPVETKPALWGTAAGAIALAIAGFTWGGWVTGGKADADATQRANAAVVVALAPICVEKFKH